MANHASVTTAASEELNSLKLILQELGTSDAAKASVAKLEGQLQVITEQVEERRLLEQAKTILMLRGGMSEPAAHQRIQKASVDAQVKIGVIARNIMQVENLMGIHPIGDEEGELSTAAGNAVTSAAATAAATVATAAAVAVVVAKYGKKKNGNGNGGKKNGNGGKKTS